MERINKNLDVLWEHKRNIFSAVLIFFVIPLTIYFFCRCFGLEIYIWLSLCVLLETMLPFFYLYEHRHPRAREVVMIALLCAMTVLGNLLSFSFLPIQAGTAMVILSGIAFGPEVGFLVGAMSRFIVNFFLGQGIWTPWQMFCWGILGFIAGLVFHKCDKNEMNSRHFKMIMGPLLMLVFFEIAAYVMYLFFPGKDTTFWGWRIYAFGAAGLLAGILFQRKRMPADLITMCFFTFTTVFLIYGGVMNICTQLISAGLSDGEVLSVDTLKLLYVSGAPIDFWHAFRASFFVLLFGEGILRRLERVKVKYGFYRI